MGFLLDNILQQSATMHEMGKEPEKLICDIHSWDALVDELVSLLPMCPYMTSTSTIYGPKVEICREPSFEVR